MGGAAALRRWLDRSEGLTTREAVTWYVVAGALALGAAGLKGLVDGALGVDSAFLSYVAAVVVAAWLGGLGGGLITTVVAAIAQALLFDAHDTALPVSGETLRLLWFVADGALLSVVASALRRISVAAQTARREATDLLDVVSRFKATVDASPDAVFMFDPHQFRVTYANDSAGELTGVRARAWIGRSIVDLHPGLTESSFREQLRPLQVDPGQTVRYAGVAGRPDGSRVPCEAVVHPVVLPGGVMTIVLTARDMSEGIEVRARLARVAGDERRQAAELRGVLEAIGEGLLVIDGGGQVRLTNGTALDMLGRVPDRLDELGPLLGLPAEDVPVTGLAFATRVVQADDGSWFEITADVLASSASTSTTGPSTIVALRDVTAARAADQAREAFIGVLSHELRTPVTTIYGYAKILGRPGRRQDQAEMLADIELESDRLYRIIEDLLALSRVEGGIHVDAEPLLLQRLAAPLVASEASRWPALRFEDDLPLDLPTVFGDRTSVEQVLRNLLANAAKYSEPPSVVTLQAIATATEVEVRVLDRGVGIDKAEADQLFRLYYRSPRTARRATGAGIGLYVSQGLVTAMGGRVWAAPRPGGGSEFGFSLRRCDEDPAVEPA